MSQYHKELVETIQDSSKWAEFSRPEFLQTLDAAAHDAFQKQSLEGYLAAFLIYQQITEDMVKNIIKLSRLYNQASVFPMIIEYRSLNESRFTFGKLLEELQSLPHEDTKLDELCKESSPCITLFEELSRSYQIQTLPKAVAIGKKLVYSDWQAAGMQRALLYLAANNTDSFAVQVNKLPKKERSGVAKFLADSDKPAAEYDKITDNLQKAKQTKLAAIFVQARDERQKQQH